MTAATVGATLLAVRSEKKLSRKALLEQLGGKPWSTGRLADLEKGKHPWSYFRPAERTALLDWLEREGIGVAALSADPEAPTERMGPTVAAERYGVENHLVFGDNGPAPELLRGDEEPHLLELVEVVVPAPEAASPSVNGAGATGSLPPLQPGWERQQVDATVVAMAVEAVNVRLAGRPAPFPWPTTYALDVAPPSDLERVARWCERTTSWLDDVDSGRAPFQTVDGGPAAPAAPTAPPVEVPGGAVTQVAVAPVDAQPSTRQAVGEVTVTGAAALTRDGLRRLTNSELQTFKHCRRRWWLSWYRGLRLAAEPPGGPKGIGTWVHEALAEWYVPEGQTPRDPRLAYEELVQADELALLEATAHLPDTDVATKIADFQKDADTGRAMVEGYVEWLAETGADVGLTVVAPEQVLSTLLECSAKLTVRVQGRLDVRLRRDSDLVQLFMDHKPQPYSARVLTPTGWAAMGDLKVGDYVTGARGEAVRVARIYERGYDDVYRVEFNDGTSTRATADHPWLVHLEPFERDTPRLLSTSELLSSSRRPRPVHFHPDDQSDIDLPLEPYTLGAWLANGDRRGREITDGVSETVVAVGGEVVRHEPRKPGYSPQWSVKLTHEQRSALADLDLLMRYSSERFIPQLYLLHASPRQRLALLRGLMDGDGTFTYTRSVQYSTTSLQLAEDVAELARSLGAWARVQKSTKHARVGTLVDGYDTSTFGHRVVLRCEFNPFVHVYHAADWALHQMEVAGRRGTKSTDKIVTAVYPDGHELCRCLQLDNDQHLYVTDGYTVTHNTVGNFTDPARRLSMDEQMKTYLLLEQAHAEGAPYVDGALYNLLRRVKRTGTAKPPFYQRLEVRHPPRTVETFRERLRGEALTIDLVERGLDSGVDHYLLAYPSPSDKCSWGCEYVSVCTMFDDGSRAEDFIAEHYVQVNPLDRYDKERTEDGTPL